MNRIVKKNLRDAKEINNLAMLEIKNKDYKKVKKYFKLNVKINPSYITFNNLTWYYFKWEELNPFIYNLSAFKKSAKYCIKALHLKSNLSSLRLLRDILYAKKEFGKAKDIQECIFESTESYQNIDNHIDDYYVMGCIYIGLNDYGSAEKYLKKAYDYYYSKKSLEDDYAFFTYALCLAKVGKYNEANKIGDYLLDVFGGESICLLSILEIYYNTNNFEKIRDHLEGLQSTWAIQEDMLAIILITYRHYYSLDAVEKKYIELIEKVKRGFNPGWRRKDLVPLKKTYEQIKNGIKPKIENEPLVYFTSNYIEF